MSTQVRILKKISIAAVNKLPKGGFKGITGEVFVMRILGVCRAVEVVTSPYGEAIKLKGEFRATGQDGAESVSGVCYLPDVLTDMIAGAVENAEGRPVEFAFDIFALPDETSTVGYVYDVRSLTQMEPTDAIKRLASNLPAPALPAPTPVPEQQVLPGTEAQGDKSAADKSKAK